MDYCMFCKHFNIELGRDSEAYMEGIGGFFECKKGEYSYGPEDTFINAQSKLIKSQETGLTCDNFKELEGN
ncbi:MAG: hypothetical protein ACTSYF_05065 [Promethearchaeota archaeon]